MSIVTRTGDGGETGLFAGKRVSKNSSRIHAYGTVDELNAILGLILAESDIPADLRDALRDVQLRLFHVGADLATPLEAKANVPRVQKEDVSRIEEWITTLEPQLPPLQRFILPSGSRSGSLLHLARTVCRRAERWVVGLAETEAVNPQVQVYLNRLSDYLFLAARAVNREMGASEIEVRYQESE